MKKITSFKNIKNKSLFFGYGSLMYYKGINGRDLRHIYRSNNELIPTTVKGLKRTMSAEVIIESNVVRFYSASLNKYSKIFGMLFKIHSKFDFIALLRNEGSKPYYAQGIYQLYDITDLINFKKRNKLKVYTLICKELEDKPELYYPGYVRRVYTGIPKKYRDAFIETGGIHPDAIFKN